MYMHQSRISGGRLHIERVGFVTVEYTENVLNSPSAKSRFLFLLVEKQEEREGREGPFGVLFRKKEPPRESGADTGPRPSVRPILFISPAVTAGNETC
ncbi:hypothetical protein WN55_02397 [Dufourea novaeangliae]|uniref:Uncharacterized protein n=1 Tax=Dufourea novaeangliae TaxID=178035 RepID=A0A154PGV2_DUFNO|nr:hypothetical protein WN55_02397 [Dufourea novaeangliae]